MQGMDVALGALRAYNSEMVNIMVAEFNRHLELFVDCLEESQDLQPVRSALARARKRFKLPGTQVALAMTIFGPSNTLDGLC